MSEASARQPTASSCMSKMVVPASPSAPSAAWAARSTTSRSGYRPNGVMAVPMIQTRSAIAVLLLSCAASGDPARAAGSDRSEAKGDRLGALVVGAGTEGGERDPHAQTDVSRVGLDVLQVGFDDPSPVEVHHCRHVRDRHVRGGAVHDRERPYRAGGGERPALERLLPASGARV